ncbi:AraC family transcriptional regulator [Sporolactobacillus sp. Y61]|uniref:AraC family transcriptional regulator n=1 Tax=Sporolactobacillus sp. Y61 TaxID=3160863 RepID=A0AAU8IBT2_9BACL|nr:AraC family transcriptional regulator [Sporolactobacillus sp. THM19-2]
MAENKKANMRHLHIEDFKFPFQISIENLHQTEMIHPHTHAFSEVIYFAEGRGIHNYNGSISDVARGDVFIIQPGKVHAYRVQSQGFLRVCRIMFHQKLLSREWSSLNHATPFIDPYFIDPHYSSNESFPSHISLNPEEQIEFTVLIDRMMAEYNQKPWAYHCMVRMLLTEMFLYLGRWSEKKGKENHSAGNTKNIIKDLTLFIRQHYKLNLTLGQIAEMCGMSQSAFTARFKKVTGRTFIDYRNRIRINAAKDILGTSDKKIIEVAHDVGFDDISHFNRTFKKCAGITPKAYRNRITPGCR